LTWGISEAHLCIVIETKHTHNTPHTVAALKKQLTPKSSFTGIFQGENAAVRAAGSSENITNVPWLTP
jgi:hypothetical protein